MADKERTLTAIKQSHSFTFPSQLEIDHPTLFEGIEKVQEGETIHLDLTQQQIDFFEAIRGGHATSIRDAGIQAGYFSHSGTTNEMYERYRKQLHLPPGKKLTEYFDSLAREQKDRDMRAMQSQGMTPEQIANALGINQTTIYARLERYATKRSPASREEMSTLRARVYSLLNEDPACTPKSLTDILLGQFPGDYTDRKQLLKRIRMMLATDRQKAKARRLPTHESPGEKTGQDQKMPTPLPISIAAQLHESSPYVKRTIGKRYGIGIEALTALQQEFTRPEFQKLRQELASAAVGEHGYDHMAVVYASRSPENAMQDWNKEYPSDDTVRRSNWLIQKLAEHTMKARQSFADGNGHAALPITDGPFTGGYLIKDFSPSRIDTPEMQKAQAVFANYIQETYTKAGRFVPFDPLFLARELFLQIAETNIATRKAGYVIREKSENLPVSE